MGLYQEIRYNEDNMMRRGKFFVIEGIDGSGKKTQMDLLTARLAQENISFQTISFPRYGHPAAYFEETYLQPNSLYGTPEQVGPYHASYFFTLDRYDASFEVKRWLADGTHVIADRYVISNAAHQVGKIRDIKERERYVEWLYDLEYRQFEIPKPDLNIILSLPVAIASRRIAGKQARMYLKSEQGAKDAHEMDEAHLRNSQEAYLWIAKKYPDEFRIVDCADGDRELNEQEIHERIWEILKERLQLHNARYILDSMKP